MLVALAVWLLKTSYLLVTPIEHLARTGWLIDDSFILMHIARNLAGGMGYSYDGATPTTGAPPLWTILASTLHVFTSPVLGAKLTASLSALFGAMSTVVVYVLAVRHHGERVALVAFAVVTGLASLFFNAMNAMETALFTFLFLLAVAWLLAATTDGRLLSRRDGIGVGVVLGLLALTRFDGGMLTAVVLGREGWRSRAEPRRVLPLLVTAVLVTAPLFAWYVTVDGTLLPANQSGRRDLAWQSAQTEFGAWIWPAVVAKVGINALRLADLVGAATGSAWLLVVALFSHARRSPTVPILVAYAGIYFSLLVLVQGYFPGVHGLRYLNAFAHLAIVSVALLICSIADAVSGRIPVQRLTLAATSGALVVSGFVHYWQVSTNVSVRGPMSLAESGLDRVLPSPNAEAGRIGFWPLADWINENLPPGTPIAMNDHGRYAYFTHAEIVDLAGIVQPEISRIAKTGGLAAYLRQRGVRYALLPDGSLNRAEQQVQDGFQIHPIQLPDGPAGLVALR